jgi:fructose-bisphosphate aldolase class II
MIPLKNLLSEYQQKHQALPAFNIDSFEIYQAVEMAVSELGLPCIVQLSPSEDKFIQAERLLMLVKKANREGLPIYLNIDHGHDVRRLEHCLKIGFDMVHFDGSKMDYSTNLATTKYFVGHMKEKYPDSLIEVEFNHINLVGATPSPNSFTSPREAQHFMTETGADLFALSIGNLHGINNDLPEHLNISLLSEIKSILGNTFLTLHGGSGVPLDQIQSAISLGIVKININTSLRLKFIESLRHQMTLGHGEKIYEYLTPVVDEVKQVVKQNLISLIKHV